MKDVSLDIIIDNAVVVQDLATQWIPSYQCKKKKNFSGNPEEPTEVPGADKETKKSFTL